MKALTLVAALSTTALAGPVQPGALPLLNPKPTGKGAPVTLYATKLPVDHVIRLLEPGGNFIMLSDQGTFEGRIDKPVPLDAAITAMAAKFVVPGPGPTASLDVDFYQASVHDLVRLCADVVRADLIWAPSKPPPPVTLRLKRADARNTARELIKLVGLQLIERGATWVVVDKGVTLDPKLLAKTLPGDVRLRSHGAMPGELEQLIDLKAAPGKCPKDRTIDASVRGGRVGLVLAVAATIPGPACNVAPAGTVPAAGTLVAILRGPKESRAVFRHAKGTQLVTPGPNDEIGDSWIQFGNDAIELYPHKGQIEEPPLVGEDVTPCGGEAARRGYALRATAKLGAAWRALFIGSDGFPHVVTEKARSGKVTISAGQVVCEKGATYALTAP